MHAEIIKQLYQNKFGQNLTKPAKNQEIIDKLDVDESMISPEFISQVEEL